jgi:hypothetical protein
MVLLVKFCGPVFVFLPASAQTDRSGSTYVTDLRHPDQNPVNWGIMPNFVC